MHRRSSFQLTTVLGGIAALLVLATAPVFAATTVNLDQWASSDRAWQNGNLNGNNSRYPEGGIVPFRVAFEGLKPGTHSIHINYDFTAGGHKAYDFLGTWDVTNAKGKICIGAGGAVSSLCPSMPSPSSYAFPSDGFKANGLSVRGAEQYSGSPRRLTIWGGTITDIDGPVHAGSVNGNSTADFVVRFRSTGLAVLLAWGGHLAQSAYWDKANGGAPDGAAQVSGAPWHMRTLQLDGAGNKNQDRSIQPSAIVGELPPQALAPPTPRPTAAPTPAAPRATPRPTATPGPGSPGGGGGGGGEDDPGDPTAAGTSGPIPTPPSTSTAEFGSLATSDEAWLPAWAALLMATFLVGWVTRRRQRRPRQAPPG